MTQIFLGEKIFVEKNPKTFSSKKNWDQKNSIFLSKKMSLKKSMKIQNFEISEKNQKIFEILKF